jgi:hypothetical protein
VARAWNGQLGDGTPAAIAVGMKNSKRLPAAITLSLVLGAGPGCLSVPSSPENANADRQAQLGIVCEAEVKLAGHFQPGAAQPADVFGCWPVGTWTFAAEIEKTDCPSPPALEPAYAFSVSRDGEQRESYRFLNAPDRQGVKLKVSSGGSGLCEGGLMIYSADGKTLVNLKPTLNADGSVAGHGEVELYATAQF